LSFLAQLDSSKHIVEHIVSHLIGSAQLDHFYVLSLWLGSA
jgi:hypothetical protein